MPYNFGSVTENKKIRGIKIQKPEVFGACPISGSMRAANGHSVTSQFLLELRQLHIIPSKQKSRPTSARQMCGVYKLDSEETDGDKSSQHSRTAHQHNKRQQKRIIIHHGVVSKSHKAPCLSQLRGWVSGSSTRLRLSLMSEKRFRYLWRVPWILERPDRTHTARPLKGRATPKQIKIASSSPFTLAAKSARLVRLFACPASPLPLGKT